MIVRTNMFLSNQNGFPIFCGSVLGGVHIALFLQNIAEIQPIYHIIRIDIDHPAIPGGLIIQKILIRANTAIKFRKHTLPFRDFRFNGWTISTIEKTGSFPGSTQKDKGFIGRKIVRSQAIRMKNRDLNFRNLL